MKGQSYIILALIFALVVAVFAVINVDAVEVNYLFGTGSAPLILVILISVFMGVLIAASFGLFRTIQLKRELKSLKKRNDELENQVAAESVNKSHSTVEEGFSRRRGENDPTIE